MLAMQMQEAAMWMMRGRELNWGAMPLSGVFETTDGALVLVGAFKANPLQDICTRARPRRTCQHDPRFTTFAAQWRTRPSCTALFRERFTTNTRRTGSAGSRSRTCCARRCATSPRRWPTQQTRINGMIVRGATARPRP